MSAVEDVIFRWSDGAAALTGWGWLIIIAVVLAIAEKEWRK